MTRFFGLLISFALLEACDRFGGFRYDPASGLCLNDRDEVGHNSEVSECGLITDEVIKAKLGERQDFSGLNLRGALFRKAHLFSADFSGADLSGAVFENVELSQASFENSIIVDTQFRNPPEKFVVPLASFRGALTNGNNVFPLFQPVQLFSILQEGATLDSFQSTRVYESVKVSSHYEGAEKGAVRTLSDLEVWASRISSEGLFHKGLNDYMLQRLMVLQFAPSQVTEPVAALNSSVSLFRQVFEQQLGWIMARMRSGLEARRAQMLQGVWAEHSAAFTLAWANPEISIPDHEKIAVPSPRVGFIKFGEALGSLSTVERLSVLVHEARHSDCTVTEIPDLLERLRSSLDGIFENFADYNEAALTLESLKNLAERTGFNAQSALIDLELLTGRVQCGHVHIVCPLDFKDPLLRGTLSCDQNANGAFAVQAAFASELSQNCEDCRATDRERLKMLAADAYSRILTPLPHEDKKFLAHEHNATGADLFWRSSSEE